ncbi:shikimate kinase [Phaeocystidibacter luteus]|uniref:Shikimate kinase n=1 Tax=Phaeocystidibacter luteus TaxID=911197 RepID=A0A6N6RKC0_9FLAO|nr:shikimate kinase [Phaeocystidibacter luteus]KAB2809876.1 shikimate kinase [Phaeocystidibacter luteus]
MQISLVGYMAAGKSTITKHLASQLESPSWDLDDEIAKIGGEDVADILRSKGEIAFRKLERETLLETLQLNGVLATGGGTPCYYDNMDVLLKESYVVYLQWPMKTLIERARSARESRPLFDGVSDEDLPEYIAKHVFDRRPYYERANHIVFCDGKSVDDITKEIIEKWKSQSQHT